MSSFPSIGRVWIAVSAGSACRMAERRTRAIDQDRFTAAIRPQRHRSTTAKWLWFFAQSNMDGLEKIRLKSNEPHGVESLLLNSGKPQPPDTLKGAGHMACLLNDVQPLEKNALLISSLFKLVPDDTKKLPDLMLGARYTAKERILAIPTTSPGMRRFGLQKSASDLSLRVRSKALFLLSNWSQGLGCLAKHRKNSDESPNALHSVSSSLKRDFHLDRIYKLSLIL